jgi:4-hydroxybenzoate polyprenyltransferase
MILQLFRLTRPWYSIPVSSGLIVLALYLSAGNLNGNWLAVIFGCIALCLIISGTYVFNDIVDIAIDRINRPDRPLPSGKVPKSKAVLMTGILYLAGLSFASVSGWPFLVGISIIGIAAAFYNLYGKQVGILKDLWSGALMTSLYPLSLLLVSIVPTTRAESLYYSAAWFFLTCTSFQMFKDICDTKGDIQYSRTGIAAYSSRKWFVISAKLFVLMAALIPLLIWILGFCKLIFLFTGIITLALAVAAVFAKPEHSIKLIYTEVAVFTAGALADIVVFG